MRKAKEIFEEELSVEPLYQEAIIEVIKQIQIDTIKETVQACAEGLRQTAGQYNSDYFSEKIKILKIADKLIEEL